jgi:ABC-type multidrug transport system fused ATPase/permease subunit
MKFQLTGKFGELSPVRDFQSHSGIDLAMPEGTTLRSISGGIVDKVFDGSGLIGKGLSVKMPDGTRAIYGHLSSVKAKVGEHVSAGEIIGLSGNTGNSTGPHLHFGLKDASGHVLDPTPVADQLATISGNHISPGLLTTLFNNHSTQGPLTRLFWGSTESMRDHVADITTEDLVTLMVGREVKNIFPKVDCEIGEVELEVKNLTGKGFKDISFQVRKGEILGLTGLVGAGRSETVNAIFGLVPPASGQIFLEGKEIKNKIKYYYIV